jgi:hypothetical protein
MKRHREQEIFRDVGIISKIMESEMVDIGECVLRAALSSKEVDVSEGGWMLHKTSKFWNRHNLMRLLRETLFDAMNNEHAVIESAYKEWDCANTSGSFPWHKTGYRYRNTRSVECGPFRFYRPVFVAWTRHRFPQPISSDQQKAIRDAIISSNREDSWCGNSVLGIEGNEHPELSMQQHHVAYILARMRQISYRCDDVVVEPVLCFYPHDEILPVLIYYLATCYMGNYYSDYSNRLSLESEIIDTAVINKTWGRARKFRQAFGATLLPLYVLYWEE